MTVQTSFTLDALDWHSWLPTVDPAAATEEQLTVLDESSPTGRTSQYYLLLVHEVGALRERSRLFKSVMYGPGGSSRAERELATVGVSRINGCPYCASVHGRLYAQLTKHPEVIQAIFDNGVETELGERERAIIDYAVKLTRDPAGATPADVEPLRKAGLSNQAILDITHAIAMFAWANRLMQTLGEPVTTVQP
jgi:uncharacterized peroxidase-related enzyme